MTHRKVASALLAGLLSGGCTDTDTQAPINPEAAARGARLAQDCNACHSLTSRSNAVGPHLVGIVGRKVASVDDYLYSETLLAQDFVWDTQKLTQYISDPISYLPGTKMAFSGLSTDEAADIVEHIRSLNQ